MRFGVAAAGLLLVMLALALLSARDMSIALNSSSASMRSSSAAPAIANRRGSNSAVPARPSPEESRAIAASARA
ncbi:MAG TPA: hypothetical protein VFS60_11185, partial [Thermoanaerobaculia bacterium]|nr:hypothetical protein [Thermoanaerobaculia bacterium]